ncbi:MAG: phosphoglycerate dehydrogenase [Verrucomicrobiota bacterium]
METYKILVADRISPKGVQDLRDDPNIGHVEEWKGESAATDEQLIEIIGDYDGVIVRSDTKLLNSSVFEAAKKLQVIGRAGVGVDNISKELASKHGVIVMNTPGGNTISTAEHAFTLMMSLARHIPHAHAGVAANKFAESRKKFKGVELNGKNLLVLGMGRIGAEFAKRAMAFNMKVLAYDPFLPAERAKELGVELVSLEDGAARADFITMHMPMTDDTKHMINADLIAKMKPSVRIVNCARGGLIDEAALLEALNDGKVAGAALDVLEREKENPPADPQLLSHPKVVLTPHLGASTNEAQENVGIEIAKQIRDALVDQVIVNSINMPNMDERTLEEVGPYLELARALGFIAGRAAPEGSDTLKVDYSGHVAKIDTQLVTRYVVKGFIEASGCSDSVNPINAMAVAKERKIEVSETTHSEPTDYTDYIEVAAGNDKEVATMAGTLFGKEPRIVRFNDRKINVVPNGHLLVLENTDVPGIVGHVGEVLARHEINIANMSLGRNVETNEAVMVLNLDTAPSEVVREELNKNEAILHSRLISLGA